MTETNNQISHLQERIKELEASLTREHENYLAVHRENMELAARNMEYKAALETILRCSSKVPIADSIIQIPDICNKVLSRIKEKLGHG